MTVISFEIEYARQICVNAASFDDIRSGQYLFNHLPDEVKPLVAGSMFDPFHKKLSEQQVLEWLQNHLIFDDRGQIIALFTGNNILWESS